jgi:hypothetical protein
VDESRRFRDGLLDLVLHGVRSALRDHTLGRDEAALIHELTVLFGIREGEFYRRRRDEVAAVLQQEIHQILQDEGVDRSETVHQEALQRIFGLAYDQYLELIRDAVTPFVDRAITAAAADGVVTPEERARVDRQLAALSTVYVLSYQQRRALGLK